MKMAGETGGLIFIHYHNNKELLDLLSQIDGILYYDGKPVMIPVKNDQNNALIVTPDRQLFVDGQYFLTKEQYDVLKRFDYQALLLTFDGKEVGLRASDGVVSDIVNQVWKDIDADTNYSWLKENTSQEGNDNDAG